MADQTEDGNKVSQRFTGGEISWDKQTNKFSTQPANLASGLAGLSVPGYQPPLATNSAAPESKGRNWFTPSWWWLFAIVPVLVLVGLVLAATLRHRGQGDVDEHEDQFDLDTTHAAPTVGWPANGNSVVGVKIRAAAALVPALGRSTNIVSL